MPTIVPLMFGFGGPPGGAPGGAPGAVPGGAPCGPCWGVFIMSIVPLNFGAAPPLRLKPHFEHVADVSGFCVPQFGQNTPDLLWENAERGRATTTGRRAMTIARASRGAA